MRLATGDEQIKLGISLVATYAGVADQVEVVSSSGAGLQFFPGEDSVVLKEYISAARCIAGKGTNAEQLLGRSPEDQAEVCVMSKLLQMTMKYKVFPVPLGFLSSTYLLHCFHFATRCFNASLNKFA